MKLDLENLNDKNNEKEESMKPEDCPYFDKKKKMCGWHKRICTDTNLCIES